MYDNIGKKIKALAKCLFIAGSIITIWIGISFMSTSENLISTGFIISLIGPIVAWISSWMLYGFGELIDKTCDIAVNTRLNVARNEQTNIDLQSIKETQKRNRIKIFSTIALFALVYVILFAVFVTPLLKYNKAVENFENGDYRTALDYFSTSSFKDSEEMVLKCKYAYVVDNYNYKNLTTYEYIKELKSLNYQDSATLFDNLYAWHIELIYCNLDKDDTTSVISQIPKKTNYLHMELLLSGGEPGENITISHKTQWPYENKQDSDWFWENKHDGSYLGIQWPDGISSYSGTFTIEFYNNENNHLIDSISIQVG